jgi:hypothetical protein
MECKISYIYGLYQIGKEYEIRYIGKSDNPKKRLRDHRNSKDNSYKSCWIKSVLKSGGDIGIKIIKAVDKNKWKEYEIETIKEYNQIYKLTNLTNGGDGEITIYTKSFEECREFIITNKPEWVNNIKSYKIWSKQEDFPVFLPKAPNRVFSNWTNWYDFLGKNKKIFLSFDECKKYLKENYYIKNFNHFRKIQASLPEFIPKKPHITYSKEWCGWEDFLQYKFVRRYDYEYLSYDDAKKWIYENLPDLTTAKYRQMVSDNKIPSFLPRKPEKFYKNFKFSDFLSFNKKNKPKEFYLSYSESIKIVHTLNIKTNIEWRRWCKNKPNEFIRIPSSPSTVYSDNWENWDVWLGK